MKNLLLSILSLLCISTGQAQDIDFCQYFYLNFSTREENGESIRAYNPEIKLRQQDTLSWFLQQHNNRFNYLLWNKLGDLNAVAEMYPDTLTMDSVFCDLMYSNDLFRFYVNNVLPNSFRNPAIKPDTFTTEEMMMVASRFFYCIEIKESDTIIMSHICVSTKDPGFNPFPRDMTLLEAFAFEGIFYCLLHEEKSTIDANFKRYVNESLDRQKDKAGNLDELLIHVRHECFALMEDDQDLKYSLINYYYNNRDNLNFTLR